MFKVNPFELNQFLQKINKFFDLSFRPQLVLSTTKEKFFSYFVEIRTRVLCIEFS